MTGPILVILLIAVIAAAAVAFVLRFARARADVEERLDRPETPTLEYAVPGGQDPVVLLAALSQQGIEASVDPGPSQQLLRIAWDEPTPKRREEIREIVSSVGGTAVEDGKPVAAADVRFEDERH